MYLGAEPGERTCNHHPQWYLPDPRSERIVKITQGPADPLVFVSDDVSRSFWTGELVVPYLHEWAFSGELQTDGARKVSTRE